jgi:hypothetical protein
MRLPLRANSLPGFMTFRHLWLLLMCWLLCNAPCVAQTATSAPGHAYIYKEQKLYGLCRKDRSPISQAKYLGIRQSHQFLLGKKEKHAGWDIYNAQGMYLAKASFVSILNDSVLLSIQCDQEIPAAAAWREMGILTGPFDLEPVVTASKNRNRRSLRMQMIYADGVMVDLPYTIIQKPAGEPVFIVEQDGMMGAISLPEEISLLPLEFTSIRYLPEHFLLGWNSEKDYLLADLKGKYYSFSPRIQHAVCLNPGGTLACISSDSLAKEKQKAAGYIINKEGKIIARDSRSSIPWPNYYFLERKRKPIKMSGSRLPQPADTMEYSLLNEKGKELYITPKNTIALIRPVMEDLYAIYEKDIRSDSSYLVQAIHATRAKPVLKVAQAGKLRWEDGLLYAQDAGQRIYYKENAEILTVVPDGDSRAGKKGQEHVRWLSARTGLLWRKNLSEPWNLYTADDAPIQFSNIKTGIAPGTFLGQQDRKWGLFRFEPAQKPQNGYCWKVRVTTIIPPQYEAIDAYNFGQLYKVREQLRSYWIDIDGKILAGGKDFGFLGAQALPNGLRLAFEAEERKAENRQGPDNWYSGLFATKMSIVDSLGNELYSMKIPTQDQVLVYAPHPDVVRTALIDSCRVLAGNVMYNLKEGSATILLKNYEYYNMRVINGRAVALSGYKGEKSYKSRGRWIPARFQPWFEREWSNVKHISLLGEQRNTQLSGNSLPFFHDATGYYHPKTKMLQGVIAHDDAALYD